MDGEIQRLPDSTYYVPGDHPAQTYECWIERPELIRQAVRDEDVSELPESVQERMIEFFTEWDPREELVQTMAGIVD